jgi:type II secretory pathway pseudopilin PulG
MRFERTVIRSGVTLLELLIVAIIIALLTAILLPSLATARRQSRRMQCLNCVRALGNALEFYRTDLGRYPDIGDRDPCAIFGSHWRPGDPKPPRSSGLDHIGDVAEALVRSYLGDPRAFYCPASPTDSKIIAQYGKVVYDKHVYLPWRDGEISYTYLMGIDYTYPDAHGNPTFAPSRESPDRRLNPATGRAVLIGDRAVELAPGIRGLAPSNHGREGGWFYYTYGDVQWVGWDRLTAHPTRTYIWYWPRVASASQRTW